MTFAEAPHDHDHGKQDRHDRLLVHRLRGPGGLKGAPVSMNTFASVIFWAAATLILAALLWIFFFVA